MMIDDPDPRLPDNKPEPTEDGQNGLLDRPLFDPMRLLDSAADRLNELLDRPFFDPEKGNKDEPGLLKRFREEFDADPELATIAFIGFYFALLLALSQQGVRIWKHCYAMPDQLCPWDVGLEGGDAYTRKAFEDLMNF